MLKTIWISFDFGLKGDYQGLYTWLDTHNAKDCGSNVACLKIQYPNQELEKSPSFTEYLKADLIANVKLSKNDRLYVVYKDNTYGKMKGKWISGNRKAPAWEGYAKLEKDQADDEGE